MFRDDFGTSLIRDEIVVKLSGNFVALKLTGNGNCLYNLVLLFFCGNEFCSEGLRIFVVGELYFNVEYYVDYEIFRNIVRIFRSVGVDVIYSWFVSGWRLDIGRWW